MGWAAGLKSVFAWVLHPHLVFFFSISIQDEGRNCSEWLMEVQALHGRQRELSGGGPVA
jgi:hypothetical protein